MTLSSSRGLTIVIDALAARFGGGAYATVQLAAALGVHPGVTRVVVACRAGSLVDQGTVRSDQVGVVRLAERYGAELVERVAWEAWVFPRLVTSTGVHGVLTISGMLPRQLPCPVVCLQANPVPYEVRRTPGAMVRRAAFKRTARSAIATYVPSEHVARLVEGVPRVLVVPLGVDRESFSPGTTTGRELLYVSDFYAHKRHDLVLRAHQALPGCRPKLRFIGNPAVSPQTFDRLRNATATMQDVAVEGRVSFDVLRAAYRSARVFVMASEHESFSMPLAEAVCAGVPAVARDHPTLRETAGSAALYVAGDDPADWTAALLRLFADDRLHSSLRTAALQQAERFSWNRMADQLVADFTAARSSR